MYRILHIMAAALALILATPAWCGFLIGTFSGTADINDGMGIFGTPGATLTSVPFLLTINDYPDDPGLSTLDISVGGFSQSFSGATLPTSLVISGNPIDAITASASSSGGGFSRAFDINISQLAGLVTPDANGSFSVDTGALLSVANRSGSFSLGSMIGTTTGSLSVNSAQIESVPEPESWALLMGGFFCIGIALRHGRVRHFSQERTT